MRPVYFDSLGYCPKCRSKLYPIDKQYMNRMGVCSYCVTNDPKLTSVYVTKRIMEEDKKESMLESKQTIMEQVLQVYRGNGYTVEKNFPGEYVFLYNPETGEKVRVYYNGKVLEYR